MTESINPQRLGLFVERWAGTKGALRSFLVRKGVRADDVDDVLQDTALKLLRGDQSWGNDMEHFRAMAYTAARWAAIDRFRMSSPLEHSVDPSVLPELSPSYTPDLASRLAFHQAWKLLSDSERYVLEGKFEERSDQEIAAALNISEATVRSIARRARVKASEVLF